MKPNLNKKITQDFNFLILQENPFSMKAYHSNTNKINSLLSSNFKKNYSSNRESDDDIRISLYNIGSNRTSKNLKHLNTQRYINRYNLKMKNQKYSLPDDNEFIFAKRNNLYDINAYNNGKNNLNINDNLPTNDLLLEKTIKKKNSKRHLMNQRNNKNKSYNKNFLSLNDNNIYNDYKKNSRMIDKFNSNYELNATMPDKINTRNKINNSNIILSYNKSSINPNYNEQKQNNENNLGIIKNNRPNMKNKKIKKITKLTNDHQNYNTEKKNDYSFDYGIDALNKKKYNNFYKKSKSGYLSSNFHSEQKNRYFHNIKYKKEEDISDKEIDDLIDSLFADDDNSTRKDDKGLSDDSFNLSEIAGDIINSNPITESETINKETINKINNPNFNNVINNNINMNMNNINYELNFNNNKITNNKHTIVNNFYISSPDIKNINDNVDNDINYNLFVVNEYNNNIENINNKNGLNIPNFVSNKYKSPFIINENINNNNMKNINEIDDKVIEFKNFSLNNSKYKNNINQNIIIGLNYSTNLNDINKEALLNNKNNQDFAVKERKLIDNIPNNTVNKNQGSKKQNIKNKNNKKKEVLKNNLADAKFNDSTIKSLLSSHKNNQRNNNLPIEKQNEIIEDNINNRFNLRQEDKIENDELKFKNSNNEENIYENNKNEILAQNKLFSISNSNNYSLKETGQLNNNINKTKRHISFNLNNNIYIKYGKEDTILDFQVTDINGNQCFHAEKDMNVYNAELKIIKPKPIIKKFSLSDIKVDKEYVARESLQEKQILPELYDEFEENDIKSLEKSLEKSIDKIIH